MGRLLEKGLLDYRDRGARAVWSWSERDKLSSQWLLCLPGHDLSLTSEKFTQCVKAHLCIPSTAASALVGEKVGRATVDIYRDTVVAAALTGDGFRKRHDAYKKRIVSLHKWAGVDMDFKLPNSLPTQPEGATEGC